MINDADLRLLFGSHQNVNGIRVMVKKRKRETFGNGYNR